MTDAMHRPSPLVAPDGRHNLDDTPEGHQLKRLLAEHGRHPAFRGQIAEAYNVLVSRGAGVDPTPMALSENATTIVTKRYLLKDVHTGAVTETPNDMCARVANKLATNMLNYLTEEDVRTRTEQEIAARMYERFKRYYEALRSVSVVPAGRTLANSDFSVPNCVVLHIEDSLDNIMGTMCDAALLQQKGSGIGFPLHLMRPAGAVTVTSGGSSSGPISFLRVYNAAFGTIKQQNRHGANMAIMKVTHPDILEFIHCKEKEGSIKNFNISVGLTNDFMKQVTEDCKEPWVPTFNGKAWPLRRITRDQDGTATSVEAVTMTAPQVFREVVTAAWRNGEPGCVFLDRVNEDNPLPSLGPIEASNPCVTADTWVSTGQGPRQVRELLGSSGGSLGVVLPDGRRAGASAFFSTGVKNVVRVETDEGVALTCTPNHRLMTADGGWVQASSLEPGSRLSVFCVEQRAWGGRGTEEEGYLLGLLKGDGVIKARQAVLSVWSTSGYGHREFMASIDAAVAAALGGASYAWTEIPDRNEFRLQSAPLVELAERFGLLQGEKRVGTLIEGASRDFYVGFLRGLFDTDGSVQGSSAKGRSVRLSQSDLECLERVQRMLLRLGVMSRIRSRRAAAARMLPDGSGGLKEYACKEQFELIVSCESISRFAGVVHFARPHKRAALDEMLTSLKRRPNADRLEARVRSVRALETPEEVFDTSVFDDSHAYDSNGLVSHNCGEQFLHDGDVCNLGAINATKVVTPDGKLDEALLRDHVKTGIMMLDDVVDTFKLPVKKVMDRARQTRRLGLGLFGWAEYIIMRGIAYDSEENLAEIRRFMGIFKETAIETSRELAKERGVFPLWSESVYAKGGDRRRNAFLSSMAPTGTTSMIADLSGGVEPLFKVAYVKKNVLGGSEFRYVNPLLLKQLEASGHINDKAIMDELLAKGTVHQFEGRLPADIVHTFRTAEGISPEWHVRVQAEFQKYVDNAISKVRSFISMPRCNPLQSIDEIFVCVIKFHPVAWPTARKAVSVDVTLVIIFRRATFPRPPPFKT